MLLDKNGAVISSVTGSDLKSDVGEKYMVMWDSDGMPIHIRTEIVDYLYTVLHTPTKKVDETDKPFEW